MTDDRAYTSVSRCYLIIMKKFYWYGKSGLDRLNVPYFRGTIEPGEGKIQREIITFDPNYNYYDREGYITHRSALWEASLFTAKGTCTPPLLYLQCAQQYSILRQIYLGYQLCAYREGQEPLSTVKKLEFCARKLKGYPGRKKTLRALKYVREGSRSPMESIICMFFSLPYALGGIGIKEVCLNYPIRVGETTRFADFYFPSIDQIVEYDSFTHHNNSVSFSNDSMRATRLESHGYRVLSIKPKQLFDLQEFTVLTTYLARLLKKRINIRSTSFIPSFTELRALLTQSREAYYPSNRCIRLDELPAYPGMQKLHQRYLKIWWEKHSLKG